MLAGREDEKERQSDSPECWGWQGMEAWKDHREPALAVLHERMEGRRREGQVVAREGRQEKAELAEDGLRRVYALVITWGTDKMGPWILRCLRASWSCLPRGKAR